MFSVSKYAPREGTIKGFRQEKHLWGVSVAVGIIDGEIQPLIEVRYYLKNGRYSAVVWLPRIGEGCTCVGGGRHNSHPTALYRAIVDAGIELDFPGEIFPGQWFDRLSYFNNPESHQFLLKFAEYLRPEATAIKIISHGG